MSSIPALPELVISVLGESEAVRAALLAWAKAVQSQRVLADNREALLVFVQQRLDFGPLERACAGFQRYQGAQGQPPRYTIGQLCRALLVKALTHGSWRATERLVRRDALVRWFVGLRLDERGPDHCTLHRFGQWVQHQQPHLFFAETLRQVLDALPTERTQPQVGDTFALHSRAQTQSRTTLLRQAASKVVGCLGQVRGAVPSALLTALDATALFGAADERPEALLDKAERDALELRTAAAAYTCLRQVRHHRQALGANWPSRDLASLALVRWEAVLAKVLHDEFTLTTDEPGELRQISHRTQQTKGTYRHGSLVDLDATFRCHGDQTVFGYNVQVAATQTLITDIFATTGATPDGSGVAHLIAHQQAQQGFVPPKLIYDRAAGLPKYFAQVAQASDDQTQLVARLIDHSQRSPRFGPLDFALGEDGRLTCPNGQTSGRFYRSQQAEGWTYRFLPDQCQGCPLTANCRGDQVKPTAYRQVFVSDYRYHQRQALAYLQTDACAQDLKRRPTIERIIAALVRYNGARHATGYGLANADFQLKLAALAFNLKRWHTLHRQKQQAQRYQPPNQE